MVAAVQKVANPTNAKATQRMLAATRRKPDVQDPAVVRQTASQFVSQLFFAPVLAEVREFPFGRDFATGGQTEAIFGEQLDQRVAEAVSDANPALVNEMVRRLQPRAATPTPGSDRASWPAQQQAQPLSEGQPS
jgi:hypothetical protein